MESIKSLGSSVLAAPVRGSRPLGQEYLVSRLTNEARTSLNHLRIMGFGICLLTRGISHLLLWKNSEDSYCSVWEWGPNTIMANKAMCMVPVLITGVDLLRVSIFFRRFIAKKICTACSNTNNIIVPVTNFNKCICTDNSEIEVDVNNLTEKAA